MASEDSDQLRPRFSVIHGLRDLGDLRQTLLGQMQTTLHHLEHSYELREVRSLRRSKRVEIEERHDGLN
jgi:hypothetical protein